MWLISAGAAVGLSVLATLYAVAWLLSRRCAAWLAATTREGVLVPIGYVAIFLAALAVITAWFMPVKGIVDSVRRIGVVGEFRRSFTVPPRTAQHPVAVMFRAEELRELRIESDQDVVLSPDPATEASDTSREIYGGEEFYWSASSGQSVPFFGWVSQLYVTNNSDAPATVAFAIRTGVEYPEVAAIPVTAAGLVLLFLLYLAIAWAAPKLSAIAAATSREASSLPLYYLALVVGMFSLVLFIYVPYNTFGEDVKMLKDSGMTLILVLAVIVALWTASVSVADEIEGRTALTLLSKPISRPQFILGKFMGVLWPVALLFILLGLLFLLTVSYKVVYDARETANPDPSWQTCYYEMIRAVPGLVLAFMETVVLAALGVAFSTRLSMLPNLILCGSIYALGHLGPLIVQSSVDGFEPVAFVGRLIAVVLPVLDAFNIQAAIATGRSVPVGYLVGALIYCILYSAIAMLLALFLFEDRDLA